MRLATKRDWHASVCRGLAVVLVFVQGLAIADACARVMPDCPCCPCLGGAQCESAVITKCPATTLAVSAQPLRSEAIGETPFHAGSAALSVVVAIPRPRAASFQRGRWRHRLRAFIELGRMLR